MEQKNNGRNYNVKKKQHNRKDRSIEENTIKQSKRVRNNIGIEERRQTSLRGQ